MHTFDTLDKLPQRCGMALEAKSAGGASTEKAEFGAVVIVGAGDAALAGRLFQAATLPNAVVPVVLSSESALPAFVGPDTLIVALSETGSEAVTVSAVSHAADLDAEIVVVSPEGHLTDMANAQGYMCRTIPHAFIAEAPLLGEIFFGLWGLLSTSAIGAMMLPKTDYTDARPAIDLMTRQRRLFGPEVAAESNPARMLTDVFRGRQPLIYGTSTLADAAALVWEDRLRRAGLPAHAGSLRGDAMAEGWPVTTSLRTPASEALILSDAVEPDNANVGRLQSAFGQSVTCNELSMDGHSALERLWGAIYLAEWTAFYLAP
jgi:glucose/mannose-6-phosphate isomerase